MGVNKIKGTKKRYVLIENCLLASEIWVKIGHVGRDFYMELKRNYNGFNNGELVCTYSFMRKRYKYSERTTSQAIKLLIENELIQITRRGELAGLSGQKANKFKLLGKHEKIVEGKN